MKRSTAVAVAVLFVVPLSVIAQNPKSHEGGPEISGASKCPVTGMSSEPTTGKCPVTGRSSKSAASQGTANQDWWPNHSNLKILHQNSA